MLAPGVPLTHPKPHWTAALARNADVEIIGDIELFCRERAKSGRECPLVAITGTNGKSTTTALIAHLLNSAGRDAQMGGNIGVPVLALEPFAPGRVYVLEVSSYQIDLAPSLHATVGILLNVTEDHLDRHGRWRTTPPSRSGCRRRRAGRHRGDRRRRRLDARRRRAHRSAPARKLMRVSVLGPLRDGFYAEGSRIMRAVGGKAQAVADLAGIGSLRGTHNAQNAALRDRRLSRARARPAGDPEGARDISRPRPPHAAGRPQGQRAVRQRFEGDQCRFRRQGAGELSPTFSGSPAASRRPAALPVSPNSSRASQGLSDRRGGQGLRRDARRQGALRDQRDACPPRSRPPRAMPRRQASRSRWCCCRRPAPRSTSTRISRCAERRSPIWCWHCREFNRFNRTVNAS